MLDSVYWLADQVLGGEEILQLPKKTEELVPGMHRAGLVSVHEMSSLMSLHEAPDGFPS